MRSDASRKHASNETSSADPTPIHISAKGVGKKFDIYVNDRGRVFELFTRKQYHEEFWALQDLSFEVPRGCAYGVIGSNGAGKSTLLKLLAGVSRPTVGELKVHASISSLLDLGLGFHQSFSGRQNIYLNCTLLGLSRPEIDALLPDIVAFAELESFIDYPVKTYSSGMSLRLGFAIASHLNYDIFLIDEVLTVGDQYFQRKCVRKIEEFIDQGRTIVLVSHDLHSVRSLCDRVLWLKEGRIVADGPAPDVVDAYVDAVRSREGGSLRPRPLPPMPLRRHQSEGVRPIRRPESEDGPSPGSLGNAAVAGGAPVGAAMGGGIHRPDTREDSVEAADSRPVPDPGAAVETGEGPVGAEQDGLVDLLLQVLAPAQAVAPGGEGAGEGAPSETLGEVAPHRDETAARYLQSQRHTPAHVIEATYRATSADPTLRQRVLSAAALPDPQQIWQPGETVQPLAEYHGELPLVTGSGEARILEVLILGPGGQMQDQFTTGDPVTVAVTIKALEPVDNPIFGVAIHRNDDVYVYGPNTRFDHCLRGTYHGLYTFFLHYPSLPLLAGTYLLSVALWDKNHLKPYVWHNRLYTISFRADREDHGLVVLPHTWGVVTHVAGEAEALEDPVVGEAQSTAEFSDSDEG